jgi:hypothetical protein
MRTLLTLSFLALIAGCSSTNMPMKPAPCAPPAGMDCCDGDVLGSFSCDSSGNAVCSSGTQLTPSNQCLTPPPRDAGNDAADATP